MTGQADREKVVFLRTMLQFGLNSARMARLVHDREAAVRALDMALRASIEFQRFRSGSVLSESQHRELCGLSIDLSEALLSLGSVLWVRPHIGHFRSLEAKDHTEV